MLWYPCRQESFLCLLADLWYHIFSLSAVGLKRYMRYKNVIHSFCSFFLLVVTLLVVGRWVKVASQIFILLVYAISTLLTMEYYYYISDMQLSGLGAVVKTAQC